MTALPAPAGHDPLRAVLVGLGARGEAWLQALTGPGAARLNVVLTVILDPDPDRARGVLARNGHSIPVVADIAEALTTRPDILIDSTTPNTRLATAREALRSGALVLCEPPLALGEEMALQLIGTVARGPGHLAVAYMARHRADLRQLRALVESGTLGRALSLSVQVTAPGGSEGLAHGILRGWASEAFDACRAILCCDALAVTCTEGATASSGSAALPEVVASFDMADGSRFSFQARSAPLEPPRETWTLVLERGSARSQGRVPVRAPMLGRRSPALAPAPDDSAEGLLGLLETHVMGFRAGRAPVSGVRDAAASLSMVLSAIRSAERGGRPEPVRPLGFMSDASASPQPRPLKGAISPEAR